jgi:hypothetical protein
MNDNHFTLNCNTNPKKFVEHPVRSLKFILKKLRIKELFNQVHDPRSRANEYSLTDLLMHGLSSHLFRAPSKNKFHLNWPCSLFRSNFPRRLIVFPGPLAASPDHGIAAAASLECEHFSPKTQTC